MFQPKTKSWLLFSVALFIGSIGAIGQAYLLYHELADCYPYKVVDYTFYANIANIGIYTSPFIAIIGGLFFGLKRFWLASIIPVISCPIIFAIVFKITSFIQNWGAVEKTWKFDGETPITAAQNFYIYSIWLAIFGLIIGAICGLVLFYLSKERINKLQ